MDTSITPAPKKTRLKNMLSRSVKTAATMQRLLSEGDDENASMVEHLWKTFNDPDTSPKDKLLIATFFAREAHTKALTAQSLGIQKNAPVQHAKSITNIQIRGDLPFEERIKLIQAEVSGVPLIQSPSQTPPEDKGE